MIRQALKVIHFGFATLTRVFNLPRKLLKERKEREWQELRTMFPNAPVVKGKGKSILFKQEGTVVDDFHGPRRKGPELNVGDKVTQVVYVTGFEKDVRKDASVGATIVASAIETRYFGHEKKD